MGKDSYSIPLDPNKERRILSDNRRLLRKDRFNNERLYLQKARTHA